MMLMSTLNRFLTGSENEWNFQIWVLYLGLKQKKIKFGITSLGKNSQFLVKSSCQPENDKIWFPNQP